MVQDCSHVSGDPTYLVHRHDQKQQNQGLLEQVSTESMTSVKLVLVAGC